MPRPSTIEVNPDIKEPEFLVVPSLTACQRDLHIKPMDRVVFLLLQYLCAGNPDSVWDGPADVIADLVDLTVKETRTSLQRLQKAELLHIENRLGMPSHFSVKTPYGYIDDETGRVHWINRPEALPQ